MHDLRFDQAPPLSPRSALRSLQGPSEHDMARQACYDGIQQKQPPMQMRPPPPSSVGMPPPRKSSLAPNVTQGQEDLGPHSHLHLPLPPQPIFEDEQFDMTSSSLSSMRSPPSLPPPQVGMRTASKSRGSLPRSQVSGGAKSGYSSGQSIHSSSDSSSIASFPLMTPPDAHSYQHHTQFPLPSMHNMHRDEEQQQQQQQRGRQAQPPPVQQIHQRTSSMQNNHDQHQLHQHLQQLHQQRQQEHRRQQQLVRGGEDDSPFAYTVDPAGPHHHHLPSSSESVYSFYSHPEYHSAGNEHRQRYAGHVPQQWSRHGLPRHALPERNSSRHIAPPQPSRSMDEYQTDGAAVAGPYLHPRHAATRASLPNQQFGGGRNSCDSSAPQTSMMAANGRILAPLRGSSGGGGGSPAGMSHRASLPTMGGCAAPASPQPTSPTVSTKRPRQVNHGSPDDYERGQHHHYQHASAHQKSAAERRSRSSDRASVRSLDSGMRRAGKEAAASSNNQRWNGPKLSHEEVMARLKEKMLQRLAAKEAAANANASANAATPAAATPSATSSPPAPPSSSSMRIRDRGDSISSSVPSTPATSVLSVGSPAMEHQQIPSSSDVEEEDVEAHRQVAATASADVEIDPATSSTTTTTSRSAAAPVMGIESLLSAAAISDK